MATPIYRQQQGSTLYIAAASMPATTLANNAFTSTAVARIQSTTYSGALLYDVYIAGGFSAAPTAGAGALQLVVVPRSGDGVQGQTPIAATARQVYTFNPGVPASTSNVIYSCLAVPMAQDQDLWIYNNGTGQTITWANLFNTSAAAFELVAWTPGT